MASAIAAARQQINDIGADGDLDGAQGLDRQIEPEQGSGRTPPTRAAVDHY
jgi:hypothetical protein